MGRQAKINAANRSVAVREPVGAGAENPRLVTTGVIHRKGPEQEITDPRQIGADRGRVNLSVPPGVDAVLARAADRLGMTRAQLALHLVVAGLPELDRIVRATHE